MKEKSIRFKNIVFILLSFLAVVSLNVSLDINLRIIDSFDGNSVLFVIAAVFIYYLARDVEKLEDKRLKNVCVILSVLLAIMEVIGNSLDLYLDLDGIFYSFRIFLRAALKIFGYAFIFYILFCKIFSSIAKIKVKNVPMKMFTANKKSFLLVWILIFFAWVPYLFRYYPGITTPDSFDQICQSLGISALTNHHPVLHTGCIAIFTNIGRILANYNIGVFLYSLTQMLILSAIFSFCIYYMAKRNIDYRFRIIALLFYALYPVNGMYSITMWKDIPFAIVMLIFTIVLSELIYDKEEFLKSKFKNILFAISMILVILFRNNGLYVVLLTAPFIFIYCRKYYKKLLLIFTSVILLYVIWKNPVFSILGVKEGSVREALSIPLQQFARIEKEHNSQLTDDEKSNIHKYLKTEELPALYDPRLSDNVKATFNDDAFNRDKITFLKTWIKLCFKYPKTAIESFLCNSYGYWYPEYRYWVVARSTVNSDVNANKVDFNQKSLINFKSLNNFDKVIDKRDIPIVSMIFSIGFAFWLVLISMAFSIYKKNYSKLLMYLPILVLWLTCLASPVSGEYRYVYAMFVCLPLLWGINLREEIEDGENSYE